MEDLANGDDSCIGGTNPLKAFAVACKVMTNRSLCKLIIWSFDAITFLWSLQRYRVHVNACMVQSTRECLYGTEYTRMPVWYRVHANACMVQSTRECLYGTAYTRMPVWYGVHANACMVQSTRECL